MNNDFLNALTPFWFITDNKGFVQSCSKYFENKLIIKELYSNYLNLKNVYIKDQEKLLESLGNKILRFTNKNEPPFRGNFLPYFDNGLFILWPVLSNLEEVKLYNLKEEMSHPCAFITDVIVAKDMYKKSREKLKVIEREKFNKEKFEQFSDIVSSTPSSFIILSKEGKIIYINQQGMDLHKIDGSNVESSINYVDFISHNYKTEFLEYHNKICNGEKLSIVYKIKESKGNHRWIETYSAPYSLGGGTIAHVAISNDITQKIKQEKELARQKEINFNTSKLNSLGQLAAGIGHEINNPLTIMKGHLNLLNKTLSLSGLNNEKYSKNIININNSIERVTRIVETLQIFSKNDLENFTETNISKLIKDSIDLVEEIYKNENVNFEYNIQKDFLVYGSANKLQLALINLFTNAKEAMREKGGLISVSLSDDDNHIQLRIIDQGHGIAEYNKDKIFEPFFSTKSAQEGTGIGLSLTNQIIKDHAGEIILEESSAKGSTFLITLNSYNQQLIDKNNKKNIEKLDNQKNILVVEDEESIREFIEFILIENGHKVTCAKNGKIALELIEKKGNIFDILITDIQMPIMNGYELLKRIKENNLLTSYIIVLSGGISLNLSKEEDGLGNYINNFIAKPFKEDELIDLIEKA